MEIDIYLFLFHNVPFPLSVEAAHHWAELNLEFSPTWNASGDNK